MSECDDFRCANVSCKQCNPHTANARELALVRRVLEAAAQVADRFDGVTWRPAARIAGTIRSLEAEAFLKEAR